MYVNRARVNRARVSYLGGVDIGLGVLEGRGHRPHDHGAFFPTALGQILTGAAGRGSTAGGVVGGG